MIVYHLKCFCCGDAFESRGARGKFCSIFCRYWFYARANDPDKCWIWSGPMDKRGYGLIYHNNTILFAHRASWILTYGKINNGLFILHNCDNPSCTNPTHLHLGTQQDNVDDRESRGRRIALKGENHGMAKITESNVRLIRMAIRSGIKPVKLEKMFSLSSGYASKIANRHMWKHVD